MPPRPVKQFYDRLFWFGFDPDVTGPGDRTMFGGTRGKFNAMDMLADREERQRFRDGGRRRRRREREEEYYDEFDDFDEFDVSPPPEDDDDDLDFVTPRGQRNRRSRGRRRRRGEERPADPRAAEYERALGLGPADAVIPESDVGVPRRRAGYAYRLAPDERERLLLLDDGEYIDVEAADYVPASPRPAADRVGDAPGPDGGPPPRRRRRRRSVDDRLLDGERVPPPGAEAWGPRGSTGTDPLEESALDALSEISRWRDVLSRREGDVEDARSRLLAYKAEAARIEDGDGGTDRELGEALAGAKEASLALRLARAERDGARDRIEELEERNWAVLSEYEARGTGFDD